ncbi:MAG: NAD-dependent epimerase/dehydratase family protein [Desulfurococcales archaeon]|nr:NAD-dependent epimerase/dehydratase family protein [Desulfurococcales archaeon]
MVSAHALDTLESRVSANFLNTLDARGVSGGSLRVILTGGAGFIGRAVWRKLLRANHEVLVIDNFSRTPPPVKEEVMRWAGDAVRVEDVRNCGKLKEIFREFRPEAVIHLAALIDVVESVARPHLYFDVNATGTASVAEAASEASVERVIYASSAAVYGEPIHLPIGESHPTDPVNPYGASKLAGELAIKSVSKVRHSPNYVILRLFNVYGPGQNESSPYAGVITKFIHRAKEGKPPIIFGDGKQVRDFIHVEDVAEAFLKALTTGATNTTFNIGSGKPITINELAEAVINASGRVLQPIHSKPRTGDIRSSYASIDKARSVLRWEPKKDLTASIREMLLGA